MTFFSGERERGAKWGAIFGFLTGIAAATSVASFLFLPLNVPVDQLLANFGRYSVAILAAQIALGGWGTFVVPFAVAVRNTLKANDPTLATGGAAS